MLADGLESAEAVPTKTGKRRQSPRQIPCEVETQAQQKTISLFPLY